MENVKDVTHHFPFAGTDQSQGFQDQPVKPILQGSDYARTTIQGINVRGLDPVSGSLRGASRTGIVQYIPSQPFGFGLIQDLDVVVWTSPAATGSGGGFQPPPTNPTLSFTFEVGYVWTMSGFNLVIRMVESTPLARTSTLTPSLNILGPVSSPLSDFPNANQGYQARITVVDQNGQAVQINGSSAVTQTLRMNTNGSVNYLGLAQTAMNWSQSYASDPGATAYVVTVALLDSGGNAIPNLNAGGNPSGGNVQVQFAANTTGGGSSGGVPVTGTLTQYKFTNRICMAGAEAQSNGSGGAQGVMPVLFFPYLPSVDPHGNIVTYAANAPAFFTFNHSPTSAVNGFPVNNVSLYLDLCNWGTYGAGQTAASFGFPPNNPAAPGNFAVAIRYYCGYFLTSIPETLPLSPSQTDALLQGAIAEVTAFL